jgi:hypothetical protein
LRKAVENAVTFFIKILKENDWNLPKHAASKSLSSVDFCHGTAGVIPFFIAAS